MLTAEERRSSRQVKRKRYTEDLEFRISDDDGDDSPGPKSPTTSEQQVIILNIWMSCVLNLFMLMAY